MSGKFWVLVHEPENAIAEPLHDSSIHRTLNSAQEAAETSVRLYGNPVIVMEAIMLISLENPTPPIKTTNLT